LQENLGESLPEEVQEVAKKKKANLRLRGIAKTRRPR
jgi:hypothetical protein